jgi:uroporphyrinogen III methyltransferase/synthase
MGCVTLVGAGCGKELLTIKGLHALEQAEVLVYDDLIDEELLFLVPRTCRLIYVGKRYGKHSMKQEEIQQILVEEAKAGNRVVRLKGGDSFVFGRGGEEILALQQAGICYEVIPGISSAIAVPEELGIPVTHRKVARSFTVITGHTAEDTEDFSRYAKIPGTLVFLMGLHHLEQICQDLQRGGMAPTTPVSLLCRGFQADQKRMDGTLATIGQYGKEAATPAIIVVGEVASYHFAATIEKPLAHRRVTVTGTEDFTKKIAERLSKEGATVYRRPYLEILPAEIEIPLIYGAGDWLVFTSGNGVGIFFSILRKHKVDLRSLGGVHFACIGKGSADRLASYGFTADFVPTKFTSYDLGKEMGKFLPKDANIMIFRAKAGSSDLPEQLSAAGYQYRIYPIYDTGIRQEYLQMPTDADDIVFASGSGARAFFEQGRDYHTYRRIIAIGEVTAAVCRKYTDEPIFVASEHSAEGILKSYFPEKW